MNNDSNPNTACLALVLAVLLLCAGVASAQAQTTSFTYQGRLTDGGMAANGVYDMQFKLYDTATVGTGSLQGSPNTVTNSTVQVANGIFTVQLDFGPSGFPGADRFLEIGVRLNGNVNPYTVLSPRQQITSTPYALRSLGSTSADALSSACSGCVSDAKISGLAGSKITGTTPVASVPAGSGNYIQNTTAPQTNSNFNISGDGTAGGTVSANIFDATTQYNLGGLHAMSFGNSSVFVGDFAPVNKNISGNTFVGSGAGFHNSAGGDNSFFGQGAGQENTGDRNAFFGSLTGQFNTTGGFNSFFGMGAGRNGLFNFSTGGANSFFGYFAGKGNLSGSNNTAIGREATFGSDNLTFATAVGAFAQVDQSNSLVLGSIAGVNSATADTNVGIGTTAPKHRLSVIGGPAWTTNGWLGSVEFANASAIAWRANSSGNRFGIGQTNGGLYFFATSSDPGTTGSPANYVMTLADTANVGIGTITPAQRLSVNGNATVTGFIQFDGPGINGDTALCRSSATHQLAFCSSSLRYKQEISTYSVGLDLVRRLHPISFTWKSSGARDLGLGAEDVAQVEPLLITRNDKGEIEGVKYDHLNVVLINAVKEQQSQIEQQRTLIEQERVRVAQQQRQIKSLKKLVCMSHRHAAICN